MFNDCTEKTEYTGAVEHIIYQNEQNGYVVFEMSTEDEELVTAVGIVPMLTRGEKLRIKGKWETTANYGVQLHIDDYEKMMPATEEDILGYLSSRTIKGLGPKTALRIVNRFGTDTFEVIENHPEWLTDIKGITLSKAQSISENFKLNFGIRSVMMFFKDYFGPTLSMKIYKKWGSASIELAKSDPYILCNVEGISFASADKIAQSLNMDKDSPSRIQTGILYCLGRLGENGHTCYPYEKLIRIVSDYLEVSADKTADACIKLNAEHSITISSFNNDKFVFLNKYYDAEKSISKKIYALESQSPIMSENNLDRFIQTIQIQFGITYAPLQIKAIKNAVNSGVTILTGGPGTGKTTIIRAIIAIFRQEGLEIALAAPTGRAAKRLSEATTYEAFTIHRLLEAEFGGDERDSSVFRRNHNDQLDADVIIIDESSMLDVLLADSLLDAVKPGARVIFVGDSDQLPSIGAGNFLSDMIMSDTVPFVALKDIFRQSEDSGIVKNAHTVRNGHYPDINAQSDDFFFISRDTDVSVCDTIIKLCTERIPKKFGANAINDIQIITPQHKGGAGTLKLNVSMKDALNPPDFFKKEYQYRGRSFREGDRVMQIKNDYDIEWSRGSETGNGIFNGDIGTITEIDAYEGSLSVDFDGRIAYYEGEIIDELEFAYAITIHKSQGSEYPIVIIPMIGAFEKLYTRNLLYTAITRAKNMVIIVGKEADLRKTIDNNMQSLRYTGLSAFLCDIFG